jgi:hypothetical protein
VLRKRPLDEKLRDLLIFRVALKAKVRVRVAVLLKAAVFVKNIDFEKVLLFEKERLLFILSLSESTFEHESFKLTLNEPVLLQTDVLLKPPVASKERDLVNLDDCVMDRV